MKRYLALASASLAALVTAAQQQPGRGQPFQPKPEDIQQIQIRSAEIEDMVDTVCANSNEFAFFLIAQRLGWSIS